jgi:hypothetical protein
MSIKIDALIDSVLNTFHYADMTSTQIHTLRLRKSAERVSNILIFK